MSESLDDRDTLELTGVLDQLGHHDLRLPLTWDAMESLSALFDVAALGVISMNLLTGRPYFGQHLDRGEPGWDDDPWDLRSSPDYWASLCSAPERTGDFDRVWDAETSLATFETDRERERAIRLHRRWFEDMCETDLVAPTLTEHGQQLRIVLWRERPFTARDRLVLRLLRPHVVEATRDWRLRNPPDLELTVRQREIMLHVREGLTNAQIGRRMGISEGTVRSHLNHVFLRLGASSRTDAVRRAFDGAPAPSRPSAG